MLIKNGKIFTMAGENYDNGQVLIRDGKIIEVGEKINAPEKEEVIDVHGAWVLPGIIDAHCHLGMEEEGMGFEGDDVNERVDPITPHLRAIDAINPMDEAFYSAVKGGITCVMTGPGSANVIGGQFAVIKTHGIAIDDMVVLAPAAIKIAFGENPKRVYGNKGKTPCTRMGTAGLLRQTLTEAVNYKNKKEKAEAKGEYFETNIKMEALIPVLERKIPLKAHAHRADDILTALRIAKEFNLKITLDHCTEGHLIADHIKRAGVPAIIGPTMTFKTKVEVKNKTFKTVKELQDKGIKVAIMTDHPVIQQHYLPICAGLAVKEGLDIEDGLKAITINAAEIAGVSDRVGSLEPGKDADLAIFTGNPMETLTKTLYTIIDGKIVYSYK
ncbi:amidohydrolase [Clostridium sp. 19966]|uniref:amidohydrolase n=1 Tax=Clostridium sp. 19966 TaxID=2768166 RepID=UPI0028DE1ECE|nr:amidohydrolase [Clostridium sp. 19966]MDT8716702.1 amidohydrolase [Clostridium sp. 19966]